MLYPDSTQSLGLIFWSDLMVFRFAERYKKTLIYCITCTPHSAHVFTAKITVPSANTLVYFTATLLYFIYHIQAVKSSQLNTKKQNLAY